MLDLDVENLQNVHIYVSLPWAILRGNKMHDGCWVSDHHGVKAQGGFDDTYIVVARQSGSHMSYFNCHVLSA